MALRNWVLLSLSCTVLSAAWACSLQAAGDETKPIPGIGPVGKIVKLHTGFKFTEGPTPDREGNVYFSDIPNERIHKVDKDGKLSVFREKSNRSNGLKVNARARSSPAKWLGASWPSPRTARRSASWPTSTTTSRST